MLRVTGKRGQPNKDGPAEAMGPVDMKVWTVHQEPNSQGTGRGEGSRVSVEEESLCSFFPLLFSCCLTWGAMANITV